MNTKKYDIAVRPNFWALLVGIDDYEAVPKLRGCVNDVRGMRDFLIRNLQVPPNHIRLLTTDQSSDRPTRSSIIAAFQGFLINNPEIARGDQILFHFSGHGSQIRDTTGLEPDGYSETLVAMDSRQGGVWDIPDKTIAALLDQLFEKKGENITVILDCCHAGSGTREVTSAGTALVRQVAPDDRLPAAGLDADIFAGASRRHAGSGGWSTRRIPYTLLAACRDRELASEHLVVEAVTNTSIWHGALTYFTLDAMRRMRSGTSYAQLCEQVAVKVSSMYPQMPQCEGQREREVFGHSLIERDPFILVKNGAGQITVEAGLIHQLHPSDKLALYSHEVLTKADLPPRPLATIEVASVSPMAARAKVVEGDKPIPALTRGLVIEVAYLGQRQTVALHAATIEAKGDPLSKEQISANQAAVDRLRRYLKRNPSSYLAVLTDPDQPAQLHIMAAKGQYGIYNANGEFVVRPEELRGGNNVAAVISSLESIARYRTILELTNREAGSRLVGDIGVNLRLLVGGKTEDLPRDAFNSGGELTLLFDHECRENNFYTVEITNCSSLAVYPHVLILNPDYSIYLLYPQIGEQNAIAPNHTLSIGLDRGQQPLEIYLPEDWDSSRDYLKVIATTQPADLSILAQDGLNVPPQRSALNQTIKSPLDKLLDAVTLGAGTRCSRPARTLAGEDWATIEFAYTVIRHYPKTNPK